MANTLRLVKKSYCTLYLVNIVGRETILICNQPPSLTQVVSFFY